MGLAGGNKARPRLKSSHPDGGPLASFLDLPCTGGGCRDSLDILRATPGALVLRGRHESVIRHAYGGATVRR